ncbi:MAG: phosphorybosylanthranilate isomerase [Phycisphaerae bacterium]|nr:phosphorybosylanthranilate isomerase [Phycisphaerae bacterium]
MMTSFPEQLPSGGLLIGMVHVRALPGTPRHDLPVDEIERIALHEAMTLADAGFDAILIENMHDLPYLNRNVGPEIVSGMTRICTVIRSAVECPVGIQVLAGANQSALAIAHCCGLDFIRAEAFVHAHVADEGLMNADAADLLRERRRLGADRVAILADICKKHASHAITADLSLADHAKAASFCGADGVIVTGRSTGEPVESSDLDSLRQTCDLPILVGSGATAETIPELLEQAHGVIIGSDLKVDGQWDNDLDPKRIDAVVRNRSN